MELGDSRWEIDHKELQLGEAVGSGAFGVVYKAKWRNAPVVRIRSVCVCVCVRAVCIIHGWMLPERA